MSQERREQLIEHYMSGGMSHAEEQQFFIEVAVDDELRRTLRAYRIIDSAIRKEREASTQGHQEVRERVAAAFLVAGNVPVSEATSGPAHTAQPEVSNDIKRPFRWITAGILAVGLVILAAIELPLHQSTGNTAQPAASPSTRLAPDVPRETSREDAPRMHSTPKTAAPGQSGSAAHVSAVESATPPETNNRNTSMTAASHRNTIQSLPQAALATDSVPADHNRAFTLQHASIDSVPRSVTTNDTLRLPVRINWKIR
jgi:hypothetical protein